LTITEDKIIPTIPKL